MCIRDRRRVHGIGKKKNQQKKMKKPTETKEETTKKPINTKQARITQARQEKKQLAIQKAKKLSKQYKKGQEKKRHRTHLNTRFHRPKTLITLREPKYQKKAISALPQRNGFDKFSILLSPSATEKAMKKMEEENTMVFLVNIRSNKNQIKEAFKQMFQMKVRSIHTLIRPDGKKKAYIRLNPENDSLALANKIGII
eukprot:TRINITY_DN2463_c0_g1_i2.p1 TRINITY_DN2463_c0_g1~~TRINITY_DN2463_c0_g1_i2.p1  ORF type:complete len:197 (-),score=38.24 TRINITY_DN2463_c0_g1_i2:186-776(-)